MTRDVASRVPPWVGHNKRAHSAFIRVVLLKLERAGLVGRLDDQLPTVWVKKVKP